MYMYLTQYRILDFTLAQRSSEAGVASWSDTRSTITPFGPIASSFLTPPQTVFQSNHVTAFALLCSCVGMCVRVCTYLCVCVWACACVCVCMFVCV